MWQRILAIFLLGGVILILGAVSTELSWQANLRSMAMVVGGTFLATLIAYPWARFKEMGRSLRAAFSTESISPETYIDQIVSLARDSRFKGVRVLEARAKETGNDFLRLGIELAADGRSRFETREALEKEYEIYLSNREAQVNILATMARLAPAFGLAGTLIGLIRMLNQLSDPSSLGLGMSLALLTTLYGILLANVLLQPLARKLREFTRQETLVMAMITEGVLGILNQDHPSLIDHRLRSLFLEKRTKVLGPLSGSRPAGKKESGADLDRAGWLAGR